MAVLQGQVVGIVAAQGREDDNTVELRRMSVDSHFRGKGIAKVLGRRVLEFAMLNNYSAVVLGTTAVKMAAHKLYESLGFRRMAETEDHTLPGMSRSLLERLFFQIRYSRYQLQLNEEWETVNMSAEDITQTTMPAMTLNHPLTRSSSSNYLFMFWDFLFF